MYINIINCQHRDDNHHAERRVFFSAQVRARQKDRQAPGRFLHLAKGHFLVIEHIQYIYI